MSTGTDIELAEAQTSQAPMQLQAAPPITLFGDRTPAEVVVSATEVAKALSSVIEDRKLYMAIRGRKHVVVEGWTLLGTMLGVFPVVEWTRKTEDGWEARVSARTLSGAEVGSAEAMCSRSEKTWSSRDEYAIRSMAQTRATSKALRLPLGFVMTLAGYDATPEEEMRDVIENRPSAPVMTEGTLMELLAVLPKCEFFDPERWTLEAVLGTASRLFGRPIEKVADLTEPEARRIIEGANALLEKQQAFYEAMEAEQENPQ